jgi:hypothetical protein
MTESSCRSSAGTAWPAMRTAFEGARITPILLAAISGRTPATVERRAAREGWIAPPKAGTLEQRQHKIALMLDEMVADVEALKKDRRTGRHDKTRIDALSAKMRMLEKLSEINESRQARQEEEEKTDAEIAAILGRVDERIVELARAFAREPIGDGVRVGEGASADRE